MSIELVSTVLASASMKVLVNAIGAYYKERRNEYHGGIGETKIKVALDSADTAQEAFEVYTLDLPLATKLRERIDSAPSSYKDSVRLSKVASGRLEEEEAHLNDSSIIGTALAISPASVFSDARKRIDIVFKLNLGLAIVLAVILLGGLAGAIASALFFKSGVWAAAFGGISAADLLGVYIFKPFTAINSALVATQRLDTIHLRLQEQLKACEQYPNLGQRIKCQTKVWEAMQAQLAVLAG